MFQTPPPEGGGLEPHPSEPAVSGANGVRCTEPYVRRNDNVEEKRMSTNKNTYKKVGLIALVAAVAAGIIYVFYRRNKKRNPPTQGNR